MVGYSKLLSTNSLIDLPDGVYTFKYKICPYDLVYLQKYHLRTTLLRTKLRQIQHHIDFSDCRVSDEEHLKKEVIDLMLLIDTGEAEAEDNNPKKASDYYQKALKKANALLERFIKDC